MGQNSLQTLRARGSESDATQHTTSFNFPTYVPQAKGTISWAVTIADVDPDPDLATATTTVK